jgi:phage shock protein E
MQKGALLAIVLATMLLAACGAAAATPERVAVAGGTYRNVSPSELRELLKNKDFVFINVHIPPGAKIAATDVSIPYDEIAQKLSQLPPEKNARIVVYCRSGHMSAIAAETLVKLGYTNIWELRGGMQAWEAAGYPVQDK